MKKMKWTPRQSCRSTPPGLFCVAAFGMMAAILPVRWAMADSVTSSSQLSQANRLSIFHDYSIDAVGQIQPTDPTGDGVFTPLLRDVTTTGSESMREFSVGGGAIGGYDSNPEAQHNARGGAFGGGQVNALYDFNFGKIDPTVGAASQIHLSYDALVAGYEGQVLKADVFQQTMSASARQAFFDNSLVLNLMLTDQFTMQHQWAALNTVDVAPSAEIFLLPKASVEITYDYTWFEYYAHTLPYRNPDASRHTVKLQGHLYPIEQKPGDHPESPDVLTDILQQSLHRITGGYDYIWNQAVGNDFVYTGDRAYVGLEGVTFPGAHNFSLDFLYSHEWDRYRLPNSEGPFVIAGQPKEHKRRDHLDVFTLRANERLLELPHGRGLISTYVQWDLVSDRSIVAARHFNEFVVSGGLNYSF